VQPSKYHMKFNSTRMRTEKAHLLLELASFFDGACFC
jgi:hypothetical protein